MWLRENLTRNHVPNGIIRTRYIKLTFWFLLPVDCYVHSAPRYLHEKVVGGRKSPNTLEWNKSSLYVDDRLDFLKGLETDTLKGFWMGKRFFS